MITLLCPMCHTHIDLDGAAGNLNMYETNCSECTTKLYFQFMTTCGVTKKLEPN